MAIAPIHLSPEVQAQLIFSAARSACGWLEVLVAVQISSPLDLVSRGCRLSYQLCFAINCLFCSIFWLVKSYSWTTIFKNSFQFTIRQKQWVNICSLSNASCNFSGSSCVQIFVLHLILNCLYIIRRKIKEEKGRARDLGRISYA